MELIAFVLTPDFEEFSGGNVSLVGGEMFDVGDALDKGNGRIVLGPEPRRNEDGQASEAEEVRANRDAQIADALLKYPALERAEVEDGDEPASFADVDVTLDSGSTKEELLERAKELDIPRRSTMSKEELAEAIAAREEELAADAQGEAEGEGSGDQEGGAGDGDASTEGSDD